MIGGITPRHDKKLLARVLHPGRLVTYKEDLESKYRKDTNVIRNRNLEDIPLEKADEESKEPTPFSPPKILPKRFNLVTSLTDPKERTHMPTLDIDVPVTLIPSSTQDHYHLYIDVEMSEEDYFKLLETLAEVGILEEGYVEASKKRGFSSLRLPGAKKSYKAEAE